DDDDEEEEEDDDVQAIDAAGDAIDNREEDEAMETEDRDLPGDGESPRMAGRALVAGSDDLGVRDDRSDAADDASDALFVDDDASDALFVDDNAGDALFVDGDAGDAPSLDDDPRNGDGVASLEDGTDPAAATGRASGELATLDAGIDSGAVVGEDVSFAAASAGSAETYESWMRHQRPSRWGRLDVGVEWQRRWSDPAHSPAHRYDEVWLLATWRR